MFPPRPTTRRELREFVHRWLAIQVADAPVIPGHDSPLDYLAHTFFEGVPPAPGVPALVVTPHPEEPSTSAAPPESLRSPEASAVGALGEEDDAPPTKALAVMIQSIPFSLQQIPIVDCVVWANRGGGKTMLGAIATLLDLVFKDGIEIRILGGSMDQSQRMHEHLRTFLAMEPFAGLVAGRITDRRIALRNRSQVELLSQSQTSVRGTRVQKLRCDEVELFDPEVWEAAQLVTRSRVCGGVLVRGAVECLSTMHVPHGIMHDLVTQALGGKRRLFKWGVVDVLERCDPRRPCEPCTLLPECGGRAKRSEADPGGHISIDDAVTMKSRVVLATWESEMLCTRPSRNASVLPEFAASIHVVDAVPQAEGRWVGGMDFGYRAPTVVLWGKVDQRGTLWIDQERSVSDVVLQQHIDDINGSHRPRLEWLGVDPAGAQANLQSGISNICVMKRAGITVKFQPSGVLEGILLVRARLRPADGSSPRLFVHRRCVTLIESMERFAYSKGPESETPDKGKGFDHAVDALRYLVQCLDRPNHCRVAVYAGN